MTLQEFKKEATIESVNTTNGWGFGGYYGKKYTLGDLSFCDAKWSYRHTGTSKYDRYYNGSEELTRKEFLSLIEESK